MFVSKPKQEWKSKPGAKLTDDSWSKSIGERNNWVTVGIDRMKCSDSKVWSEEAVVMIRNHDDHTDTTHLSGHKSNNQ